MSDAHRHGHDHGHDHGDLPPNEHGHWTREFWDERYAGAQHVWSGRPNARLVEHAAGVRPGTAVDVGCGEGADAVWLAGQGWEVTGVDISQVALDKAARHAEEAGVAERCTWRQVDLIAGDPLPEADLVSAQFLHVPTDHFEAVYGALARAVRPGGTLLVGAHHPDDADTGLRNSELSHLLMTPDQVTAVLDPAEWDVRVAEAAPREVDEDRRSITVTDTVVVAVRRA